MCKFKTNVRFQLSKICYLFISVFSSQCLLATGGGSSISGGDPLYHFLEATRTSLVSTTKIFYNSVDEQKTFCVLPGLDAGQVDFCRMFFQKISRQILQLNQGSAKTTFVIRDEPLMVEGSHGEAIRVPARTLRGSAGDVEFDRELAHVMGPQNILMLIAHEFGHKSEFEGRYIDDNEMIPHFVNGRELLDTMAAAVLDLAKRHGLIGEHYGLYDHFQCLVSQNAGQPVGMMTSNARTFYDKALTKYEAGFGYKPTSPGPYVFESSTNSSIQFKIKIFDPHHCDEDPAMASQRRTELQLLRDFFPTTEHPEPRQELIETLELPAYNPLCERERKELKMMYGAVKFSCKYYGTEGNTSTFVPRSMSSLK